MMKKMSLSELKARHIIKDPTDIVSSTWLKEHPSLGQSDEVVWEYESVRDEFKTKILKNIKLLRPIG